jgi:serine/threonine protein kinase
VYSLGLVLIEALTGERPFPQASPQEAIAARLSVPPAIPGTFGYRWRSLLTAMTSLDPEERPSALDVAARGRELEYDDVPADMTSPVVTADTVRRNAWTDGFARSGPSPHLTAATALLPRAADPAPPVEQSEAAPSAPRGPWRHGRVWAALAAAAAVVAAATVSVVVWAGAPATSPEPPQLPQLQEPLDAHLQQLLDEVTP